MSMDAAGVWETLRSPPQWVLLAAFVGGVVLSTMLHTLGTVQTAAYF